MRNTIATGILGMALCASAAAAKTAGEPAQILRDFEQRVDDYARHHSLSLSPEAVTVAAHAAKIFTPPVAVVFRQLIAHALTPLPAPFEYRLIDNDLVIRDANGDLIIAVLPDAAGVTPAR